ncbi:MAG: endolytic transglycosylase MltG [Bacillota bacterium]|nr:endolytic transglycosylase MltG [Bacillota bacterium]
MPFLILLVLVMAAGAGVYTLSQSALEKAAEPVEPGSTEIVAFSVPAGSSTTAIAAMLEEQGLINSERAFKRLTKRAGYDGQYQAGNFSLSPGMSTEEIMEALLTGRGDTVMFTVPEGYDIRRTTEKLAGEQLIDAEAFAAEIETGEFDYWFTEGLPEGPDRLEGYLFPETYQVYKDATERDIILRMLDQFEAVFTEEYRERAAELGMSVEDVITLASIVEREAVVSEDRPVIAGVFYNRLEIGMPLQSCATVQYILGEQKPVLSVADTQIESPYNTYLYGDLPPGPICSPGEESIRAVLYPQESDYLYFLAKGDGSHVFSVTYEEHLENKALYID